MTERPFVSLQAALHSLPPLRDVIKSVALSAKRGLGQNFLMDLNITAKIARLAGASEGGNFLEIGPGPGGLTRALLSAGAGRLTVVEKDERCLPVLLQIQEAVGEKMEIITGDALKIELPADFPHPFRVTANLPYNISTQMLLRILTGKNNFPKPEKAFLMFQKEFAQRLCAKTGEEHYGRLSVLVSLLSSVKIIYLLPPDAFTPAPKIFSALTEITPYQEPSSPFILKRLEEITAAAFSGRRKMIRTSLKSVFQDSDKTLREAGMNPDIRAENLSPADYAKLSLIVDDVK